MAPKLHLQAKKSCQQIFAKLECGDYLASDDGTMQGTAQN
jgi:hypothetical protein